MQGLTQNQVEHLRRATEEVLEKTGFQVQHEGLLRLAAKAGARVEESSGTVRFPASLLRELIRRAPARYCIAGSGGRQWEVGGEMQYCLAIVTDPWIVDYRTQQPRRPCLEDIRRHTRVAQRLEPVAALSLMDYPVTDHPGPASSLRAAEEYLLNHDKHLLVLAASDESLERWLRLAQVLAQGRELSGSRLLSVGVAVRSPLTLTGMNAELLLRACEHDLPVLPTDCPMAGTTAPYSKTGTLLLANAEVVALGALTQLIRPGHPYLYIMGPSRMDPRNGEDLYYTLDKVLWKAAGVQLGKEYGLPTAAECGGAMSWRCDLQAGAEGVLFMLAAQHSGAHLLSGIGSYCNAVGMSGEMMLVQTAWLKVARFLGAGLDTQTHLGLESIARVGPGGNFLADELTLELLRSAEFFDDELFACEGPEAEPMLARAHRRVEELAADFDSPLPGQVQEELRRFFREEYARLENVR